MQDPELKDKSVSDKYPIDNDPFRRGLYVAGLTKEQVDISGLFFNELYEKLRGRRQVTRNAQTMLRGAVFALGTKDLQNMEWKEHSASSLREPHHEWDGMAQFKSDFISFYRNQNNNLTLEQSQLFDKSWLYYRYFTGIAHHDAATIMGALKSLLQNNLLKLEDCYRDEVFVAQVKGYFLNTITIAKLSKNTINP